MIEATIKGGAILLVAAFTAMMLRRDSAATRHLVWLVAVVAILLVPLFSALLPQWRVLPEWTEISLERTELVSVETTMTNAITSSNRDGSESSRVGSDANVSRLA